MRPTIAGALLVIAAGAAEAQPMDYAKAASWLCRPDANGPCDTDLALTDVSPADRMLLPPPAAIPPKVDCFYVYPTVSRQPGGNSDGTVTAAEIYVVQQQFARFGEVCRRFAPLYRQTTLASIAGAAKGDAALAYGDVKAAWDHYLSRDNDGRGVIMIGHSQGARHLMRLVAEEVVGKPVADRVVAAHIIGFPLPVADAESAAEAPPALPLCRRASQTGCTVAYVTFAQDRPPAADNRFAGRPGPGLRVACTDLGRMLDTPFVTGIFPSQPQAAGSSGATARLVDPVPQTPSYQLSASIRASCAASEDGASYLAVSSADARVAEGFRQIDAALPGWGLHLIDVNVAQGSLIALARRQAEAWVARAATAR